MRLQGIRELMDDIGRYPRMAETRIVELSALARQGDIPARNAIVEGNLRLVVKYTLGFRGPKDLLLEEATSAGMAGLIRAAEKFDPSKRSKKGKPIRFSTFAMIKIKERIQREVRGRFVVHVPNHIYKIKPSDRNRRPMLVAAQRAKATQFETRLSDKSKTPNYLSENLTILDPEPIEADPKQTRTMKLLAQCSDREQRIMRLRYGLDGAEPISLQSIGDLLGLTRERIRQIEKTVLTTLGDW